MRLIVIIISLFIVIVEGSSQQVELRSIAGITYYQGDLSPLPLAWSFSEGHAAYGTSIGLRASKHAIFNFKIMKAKISGDDADASSEGRRRRNLSFESNIYEFGFSTDLSWNFLFSKLDKYGIDVYSTVGVNLFHFNPYTEIDGEQVFLQRLGTEGQGLIPGKSKYALTGINIPFGAGFRIKLNNSISLGFEVAPRWTFTDYLDDVSTTYVNYDELLAGNGELAAQAANRTGEFLGSDPVKLNTGVGRGDPSDNDWYLFTGMYVSYKFGKVGAAVAAATLIPMIPSAEETIKKIPATKK